MLRRHAVGTHFAGKGLQRQKVTPAQHGEHLCSKDDGVRVQLVEHVSPALGVRGSRIAFAYRFFHLLTPSELHCIKKTFFYTFVRVFHPKCPNFSEMRTKFVGVHLEPGRE